MRTRLQNIVAAGCVLLFSASLFPLSACSQELPAYPEAHAVDQVDTYHGTTVADPYRWMENLEDPALHEWLKAQDQWLSEYMTNRDLVKYLTNRIKAIGHYERRSMPTVRGDFSFYIDRAAGQSFGTLKVAKSGEEISQLVDFEKIRSEGYAASTSSVSPDGTYITINTSEGQSRWSTLTIIRVEDGKKIGEPMTGFYGGRSNIAWRRDGAGFFYARYDVPENPQSPLGVPHVYYHTLGSLQSADQSVFELPEFPSLSFALRTTHDGDYLIFEASESGGTFNGMYERLFYKDLRRPNSPVVELFEGMDALFAFEGSDGSTFRIRTTHQAPNMRVVQTNIGNSEQWKEIIPEAEESIQAVSEVGSRLVVQYIKDARTLARIFDLDGKQHHELDYLSPSMAGFADNRESSTIYFGAPPLVDPGTLYALDVESGKAKTYFSPELNHDPTAFERKQVFYKSKDGTRVPMFILHKKGLILDSSNPVFLYGYGAWSWSAFPWQVHMIPWMEMGGVYAIANIRGGGEYGEAWHKAGIRHKKQNGIDDFIGAAEWLIDNNYTSPERMIANGGSASGVLPGAAIIQRPELFGASVINFPTLDKVRYTQFGSAKSWVSEFGDPENAEDFEALYAYSPYHKLEANRCYPATWIQVGEKDETTTPMHGYKFAAALQAAQTCDNPVALKISWGAGHSYGLTPEQSRETRAEELAFLAQVMGLGSGNVEH